MQSFREKLNLFLTGRIDQDKLSKYYDNLMITSMKRAMEHGIQFAIKNHSLEFAKGYNRGIDNSIEEIKSLPDFHGLKVFVKHIEHEGKIYLERDSLEHFLNETKL